MKYNQLDKLLMQLKLHVTANLGATQKWSFWTALDSSSPKNTCMKQAVNKVVALSRFLDFPTSELIWLMFSLLAFVALTLYYLLFNKQILFNSNDT